MIVMVGVSTMNLPFYLLKNEDVFRAPSYNIDDRFLCFNRRVSALMLQHPMVVRV